MPTPARGAAYVKGSDNLIYLFSGYGGGSNRSQCYRYNPSTNAWTALANVPTPVWAASAAVSGNLVYLFGGQTSSGAASNSVQIYNTQTNTWSTGASMPTALMQAQAVRSYNSKIYLFGGRTAASGGLSDAVHIYNPSTNSWSAGAAMPIPKAQFATVLNNDGRIYVIGGRGSYLPNQGPFFQTVEIYDPKSNSWSEGPALPSPLGGLAAVNSYGNLFVMGGSDGAYRNYNWRLVLPPVAPTSAKATALSSSQIKVEWVDAAGNENRYEVERSQSGTGPWTVIATTAANAITYTDGSRAANTPYYYRIRGGNSSGYGPYSPIVSATTWAAGAAVTRMSAEEAAGLQLQAAPNPFSGNTTVRFAAQGSGKVVLELYDLQGVKLQRVFEAEVQAGEAQQVEVNGSRLTQGLYLLRLVNGSQVQHLKLLLNK
jgi:N-acetylneuraminic acid mutarotase